MKMVVLAMALSLGLGIPAQSPVNALALPEAPGGTFASEDAPCAWIDRAGFPFACTFPLQHENVIVARSQDKAMVLRVDDWLEGGKISRESRDARQVITDNSSPMAHIIYSEAAVQYLQGSEVGEEPLVYVVLPGLVHGSASMEPGETHVHSISLSEESLGDCIEACALGALGKVSIYALFCVVALVVLAVLSGGVATPTIIALGQSCMTAPLKSFIQFAECVAICVCTKEILN